MDVFEAIHNRHSQKKVKQDPVPRELIEKILSAGVQAPNHYKVRPWRFVVLMGNARDQLGEVMAASLLEQHPDFPQAAFDKARTTPLQAPVIIAVGADKPTEARSLRWRISAQLRQPAKIFCLPHMHWGWAQSGGPVNGPVIPG